MPDSHRLPFYALAGTQDVITLTQVSTSQNKDVRVLSFPLYLLLQLAQPSSSKELNWQALERNVQALPLNRRSVRVRGATSIRQKD
jgi:hypothetical protein